MNIQGKKPSDVDWEAMKENVDWDLVKGAYPRLWPDYPGKE